MELKKKAKKAKANKLNNRKLLQKALRKEMDLSVERQELLNDKERYPLG